MGRKNLLGNLLGKQNALQIIKVVSILNQQHTPTPTSELQQGIQYYPPFSQGIRLESTRTTQVQSVMAYHKVS